MKLKFSILSVLCQLLGHSKNLEIRAVFFLRGENNSILLLFHPTPSHFLLMDNDPHFYGRGKRHIEIMDSGLWKTAESQLEPSLPTITAGFSPKIPSPSAMTLRHRKGIFIVSLRLTALDAYTEGRFQNSPLPCLKEKEERRKTKISHIHCSTAHKLMI